MLATTFRRSAAIAFVAIIGLVAVACSSSADTSAEAAVTDTTVMMTPPTIPAITTGTPSAPDTSRERIGEQTKGASQVADPSGGEKKEEGESGAYVVRTEPWDVVRNGVRLQIKFDESSKSFLGTVHNITSQRVCGVRVEVNLDNGRELGPMTLKSLAPEQTTPVALPATNEAFDKFTAHAEKGSC